MQHVRKYFFAAKWYEVYDFVEFVVNNHPYVELNEEFVNRSNMVLEGEASAYRFVGKVITKITDETEMSEIEEVLELNPVKPVREHIRTALTLLSDRKDPDYRNSSKESISAVESMASIICGDKKATLGDAIKKIEEQGKMQWHPALKSALDKLYGYTSDEGGIRHFLKGDSKVDFEEAKFMLVTCSAFVNYLTVEAAKAGIKL